MIAKWRIDVCENNVCSIYGLELIDVENAVNQQDKVSVADNGLLRIEKISLKIIVQRLPALFAFTVLHFGKRLAIYTGFAATACPIAPRILPILRVTPKKLLDDILAIEMAHSI